MKKEKIKATPNTTILMTIIATFFIGAFFWGGALGFNDPIISGYGAILFMGSLCFLIVYGLCVNGGNKIWSVITGVLLFIGCFSTACLFGTIPFMPSPEEAGTIYGILALPFIMAGAGSGTGQVIIIII